MVRILFTSTLGSSAWAGSEQLWFQSARCLATAGHKVAAVLPKQMHVPETTRKLGLAGIQLLRHPLDVCRAIRVRLSRRRQPQNSTPFAPPVYHARCWNADLVVLSQASCWGAYSEMLALADLGIPYVCLSQLNTPFSWPGDNLYETIARAFSAARTAVFVSQGNLELFQNQVACKLSNATVIYNPPSFDVSSPCASPPINVFRVLNVARINPAQKGHDLLVDVFSLPKWRGRAAELLVAGDGNLQWLKQLIRLKDADNIKLLGHVTDLRKVWEGVSFGVFPSRYEGIPLAMIEGMALGRAMIATDVAGHSEWIEDAENGFLATGTTAKSLDAALECAWERREQAGLLGAVARATYERYMIQEPSQAMASLILRAIT